jgi:hypothetical protein
MLLKLRDYQQDAVAAVLAKWQEFDRLLGVAPTGSALDFVPSLVKEFVPVRQN